MSPSSIYRGMEKETDTSWFNILVPIVLSFEWSLIIDIVQRPPIYECLRSCILQYNIYSRAYYSNILTLEKATWTRNL